MALTVTPSELTATALTLTTAAQPNITSVGTLTGLALSGNATITKESPEFTLTDSSSSRTLLHFVDDNNSVVRASGPLLLQSGGAVSAITLDASQNATFGGTIATGGITINGAGSTISDSSDLGIVSGGTLTMDITGELIIDTDLQGSGNGILLKDAGTLYGSIFRSSSHLHIKAEDQDKNLLFLTNNGGSELTAMAILSDGNVGIGTNNPTKKLHVIGDSNEGIHLKVGAQIPYDPTSSTFYSGLTLENLGSGHAFSIGYGQGARLKFSYFDNSSTYEELATMRPGGDFYPTGSVVMADGEGINFAAVTGSGAASGNPPNTSTSNSLLDDYEEGTFSAQIQGQTTAGSFNYTLSQGRYTKVGNLVSVVMTIYFASTNTSPAGNVLIKLPFTASTGNTQHSFYIGWSQYITFPGTQLAAYVGGGGNSLILRGISSGGSAGVVQGSDIGSSMYLMVSGTYYV